MTYSALNTTGTSAQRYEQLLEVSRLYRALILLFGSPSSDRLCIFGLSSYCIFWLHPFLPFSELRLVGLALDLVD